MKIRIPYLALLMILVLSSCNNTHKNSVVLSVSIAPIKYIVERITCGDFPIEVIVPAGANPESYSPSPGQLIELNNSKLLFTTGLLDMEKELTANVSIGSDSVIELARGIKLMYNDTDDTPHSNHAHGTDPHIWMSPKQLKTMAANAYDAIKKTFPDSLKYDSSYLKLQEELDRADCYIQEKVARSPIRSFIIYHPSLGYYARDYSLQQISMEKDGKEPSAVHMQTIVDMARRNQIPVILYQKEYAENVVKMISADIGAIPVTIDPLEEDIVSEIIRITDIITAKR